MNTNITPANSQKNDGSNIPAGLPDKPHYVAWRLERRKGELTKIPIAPETGGRASSTDSSTWGTYKQARERDSLRQGKGGVGYVFSDENAEAGIDIDDCRNPNTGEIADWATQIIKDIDSYTEVSPSGTGVKIFLRGEKPGNKSRVKIESGEVEIYDRNRFFTLTGEHLSGTPESVQSRSKQFAAFYGEYFGNDQQAAQNGVQASGMSPFTSDYDLVSEAERISGDKFRRLMSGDTSGYGGDDSRARAALIGLVRWYAHDDRDQIARIVRMSGFNKPKLDQPRGDKANLLEYEIDRMAATPLTRYYVPNGGNLDTLDSLSLIGQCTEGSSESIKSSNLNSVIQARSFGEIGKPDPVQWYVKDLIPAAHPSTIYGAGGEGKSFLALDMGIHIAAGKNWLGHEVKQTRVLYLDFELDEDVQSGRAHLLAAGAGMDTPPDNLLYLSALELKREEALQIALATCEQQGIGLVMLDSVGPAMQGDAESSKDVIEFVDTFIKPFRAAGAGVLMVDHQSKPIKGERPGQKLPFGSVYKTNLSRSVIQVSGRWDGPVLTTTLTQQKGNLGPKQDPFDAELCFEDDRITVESVCNDPEAFLAGKTSGEQVLDALQSGPQYVSELAAATGLTEGTVGNRLSEFKGAGKAEPTGEKNGRAKQWRVTDRYAVSPQLPAPHAVDEAA